MSRPKDSFDRLNPSGVIGYRAWLMSEDEHGNRIGSVPAGFEGMHVNETRAYAPGPTPDATEEDERRARTAKLDGALDDLTDTEREVLRLQGKLTLRKEQEYAILAGDLVEYQRRGYQLKPKSAHVVEHKHGPPAQCVIVTILEEVQVEALDYQEIAARLGLTYWQVQRAVKSANRKMRARR